VVCLPVTQLSCAKTAKRIDVLFGMETLGIQETLYWMGVPLPYDEGKGKWEMLPIVQYTTVTTDSHSPDGAVFNAALGKSL